MAQPPTLWKKRILIPFWIVRICLMIVILVGYALTLRTVRSLKDVAQPAVATVVLFMLMIVIVLLLDVMAIVLFLRDALKPGTFLTMNVFQTTFWAAVLALDVVALFKNAGSMTVLGFSVFVFLSFLGLTIYSFVGFKKARNAALRGKYAPANNPAVTANPLVASYAPHYQANDAYQSQMMAPLHSPYLPPYEASAMGDHHSQQPMKPAYMV